MRGVIVLLALMTSVSTVFSQEMLFLAQPSTTKPRLNEIFTIEYSITNPGNVLEFQLPLFDPLSLAGPIRTMSSTTDINGKRSHKLSYIVSLQASKVGKYKFKPAKALLEGSTIHSNALEIEVVNTKSTAPMPQAVDPKLALEKLIEKKIEEQMPSLLPLKSREPYESRTIPDLTNKVFASAEVDRNNVFKGEQIIVNYYIYTQLPIQAQIKKANTPTGFWMQELPLSEERRMQYDIVTMKGKEYRKYIIRQCAVFPTLDGTLSIPPIEINGSAQVEGNSSGNIFGILENMFSSTQQVPFRVFTDSVQIFSHSLPSPIPVGFKGAVGSYTLESNIDKVELTTDEAIQITYHVRGRGNLKQIPVLTTYYTGDFEASDPQIKDSITNKVNHIAGYRTFTYTLIPRNEGKFYIPPAQLIFFDPEKQSYEVLKSNGYEVFIKPGSTHKKLKKNKGLPQDIHDILNEADINKPQINNLFAKYWYWLLYLVPFSLLIGSAWWKNTKIKKSAIIDQPLPLVTTIADQRLQVAKDMLENEDSMNFYNELHKTLWLFISDKAHIPLSKLDRKNVEELLRRHDIGEHTIQETKNYIHEIDAILFGQKESIRPMASDYYLCKEIIEKLERSWQG